jgi:hypothetical protein
MRKHDQQRDGGGSACHFDLTKGAVSLEVVDDGTCMVLHKDALNDHDMSPSSSSFRDVLTAMCARAWNECKRLHRRSSGIRAPTSLYVHLRREHVANLYRHCPAWETDCAESIGMELDERVRIIGQEQEELK